MPTRLQIFDGFPATSPHLNAEVKELQRLLRKHGYEVSVDGFFGSNTQRKLKEFQQKKQLVVSGVADAATWAALNKIGEGTPATTVIQPAVIDVVNPKDFFLPTPYLDDSKDFSEQLLVAVNFKSFVVQSAAKINVQASIIAGILSRESRFGLALFPKGPGGTGDGGHGRGLMQIDDRWHIDFIKTGMWQDPKANIEYGCGVLRDCFNVFDKFTNLEGLELLRAAIAGYNGGPRNVLYALSQGLDPDAATTGLDYSKNVLERAGWFQRKGW